MQNIICKDVNIALVIGFETMANFCLVYKYINPDVNG